MSNETWHGTPGGYGNHGCRCPECTAAASARIAEFRRNRKGEIPHGTDNGYTNWRCRCRPCVEAHGLYREERHARKFLARHGLDLDAILRTATNQEPA